MGISRYDLRRLITNNSELYSEIFKKRDVKYINHFLTPEFLDIEEKKKQITYSFHVWSHGDKLYKLAYKHYGQSDMWWIIALVNQKPTESHFSVGDIVLIPQPLNLALEVFKV